MYLVFNSVLSLESGFGISSDDRAFQYGDGLFETLRYERGHVAFWPDHYDRLRRGMAALQLDPPDPFTSETLHNDLVRLLAHNQLTETLARIRIQVWRQPGGLYTPATCTSNILLTARSGQSFGVGEKKRVGIFEDVRLSPSLISPYKTANALPYVLAGLARQMRGFDEMLLLDTNGHVAECVASALFWLRGSTFYVPSLKTGCIDGILRRQLLRLAPTVGFDLLEGLFLPDDLAQADAVFCGNVMGIQQFGAITDVADYAQKKLSVDVKLQLAKLFEYLAG